MTERAAALMAVEEQVQVLMRRIKRVIGERAAEVHPDLQPSSFLILGWLAEHGPAWWTGPRTPRTGGPRCSPPAPRPGAG
jgi:hypothetical protein